MTASRYGPSVVTAIVAHNDPSAIRDSMAKLLPDSGVTNAEETIVVREL